VGQAGKARSWHGTALLASFLATFLGGVEKASATAFTNVPQTDMANVINSINTSIGALSPARATLNINPLPAGGATTSCNLCHVPTSTLTPNPNSVGGGTLTALTTFGNAVNAAVLADTSNVPIPAGFAPTAGAFATRTTPLNTALIIDVSTGATDPLSFFTTNVPLTASIVSQANGTTGVSGTTVTFTPTNGFTGPGSFTFLLYNQVGNSSQVTVNINIGVNSAPVAANQGPLSTPFNTAINVDLKVGAGGGSPNTAALVGSPVGGTVTGFPATNVSFTPSLGFTGTASFQFTLTNGFGTSSTAQVTIAVGTPAAPARPAPDHDATVLTLLGEQAQTSLQMASLQLGNFSQRLEELRNGATGVQLSRLSLGVAGHSVSMGSLARLFNAPRELARRPVSEVEPSNLQLVRFAALADQRGPPMGSHPPWLSNLVATEQQPMAPASAPYQQSAADEVPTQALKVTAVELPPGVGVFVDGQIGIGSQSSAFDYYLVSLSGGVDYRFNDNVILGVGAGYSRTSSNLTGGGAASGEEYNLALYGVWAPFRRLFIEGVIDFGAVDINSQRVTAVANAGTAIGSRTGSDFSASMTAGYDFLVGLWTLTPYMRATSTSLNLDPFTETGAGTANLTYSQQTVNSLLGVLGFRMGYNWRVGLGAIIPYVRAEFRHDYDGSRQATLVNFVTNPNATPFSVSAQTLQNDVLEFGAGVDGSFLTGLSLSFQYETIVNRSDVTDHRFMGVLSQRF